MARDPMIVHVRTSQPFGSWSRFLRGVGRFALEHGRWSLRVGSVPGAAEGAAELAGAAGLITWDAGLYARAQAIGLPAVAAYNVEFDAPRVALNDARVGATAAEYLLRLGHRRLTMWGVDRVWARRRWEGFDRAARARGVRPDRIDAAWSGGEDQLSDRLAALPAPTGLFAANDGQARRAIRLLHGLGRRVPEDVAVLGVDNNPVDCEFHQPGISSVDTDPERAGYETASLLEAMINGRPIGRPLVVPPRRVVERDSTRYLGFDDPLLSEAVAWLRAHAFEPVRVADVLNVVPLSRRRLEQLFREQLGHSPGEEVRRVRMARARTLLIESRVELIDVAVRCGFASLSSFSQTFKREHGVSPGRYRKAHASPIAG
ncbi:MAG: substrate-binding domain-containing protein [Planctomycetota bacterium]